MKQELENIPKVAAKAMPNEVSLSQDGSVRYSDGNADIAITKQGDAYTVYDYTTRQLSKNLTRAEVNNLLRDYAEILTNKKLTTHIRESSQKSEIRQHLSSTEELYHNLNDMSSIAEKTITKGMSDEQRYEILKDKKLLIEGAKYSESDLIDISSVEALNSKAKSKAEKLIVPLAERLGILGKKLSTPDVDINFVFSKNKGLTKSLHSQLEYGGSYSDLAKAFINLDKILNSAVLIEQHSDKYKGTVRENKNLREVYVLVSGFIDDNNIIPIQLEIKNTTDYGGRLYLTVAMTKIEADVVVSAMEKAPSRLLVSASAISIADIFRNVNPADKNFLKYVPDGFLSSEQKYAKDQALLQERRKIESKKKTRSLSKRSPKMALPDNTLPRLILVYPIS